MRATIGKQYINRSTDRLRFCVFFSVEKRGRCPFVLPALARLAWAGRTCIGEPPTAVALWYAVPEYKGVRCR